MEIGCEKCVVDYDYENEMTNNEMKQIQLSTSPDVPLFKKKNPKTISTGIGHKRCRIIEPELGEIMSFVSEQLAKTHIREDYREFLELTECFITPHKETYVTIRPPGAMHQARWMSRAIYCLKIFLLREQCSIPADQEDALADVCNFIIKFYVKAWFNCPNASEACVNDLNFLQNLILYKDKDPETSEAAVKKLCNHLWYLVEETSALAFFDVRLNGTTRTNMVNALQKESKVKANKKLLIDYKDIQSYSGKFIDFFISSRSMNFFSRFNIDSSFLKKDPQKWENDETFVNGRNLVTNLMVVNDTAERAVKLVEEYHGLLTKDESQFEYVMQCVHNHRKLYPNCTKITLNTNYEI